MRKKNLSFILFIALMTSCTVKNRLNVLVITVDALRADHLSINGYYRYTTPNIDNLARNGWNFTNAYSAYASTGDSIHAIHTGCYPNRKQARWLLAAAEKDIFVSEILRSRGYRTAAIVGNFVLIDEMCGYGKKFNDYFDFVEEKELKRDVYEKTARYITKDAMKWLKENIGESPFMLWLHYQDPHGPYYPPLEYRSFFQDGKQHLVNPEIIPEYVKTSSSNDVEDYIRLYDQEIRYVDTEIGRLIHFLETNGIIEETLIVISADHGEALGEHDVWFTHSVNCHKELVNVPLILYAKNKIPARRTFNGIISNINIFSTILDIIGIDPPHNVDSVSLLRNPQPRKVVISEAGGREISGRLNNNLPDFSLDFIHYAFQANVS